MSGTGGLRLINSFVSEVFPEVDGQLDRWSREAGLIGDEVLRSQALASIEKKKFHCQGGSVYCLYPGVSLDSTVRFITAFQTISDYLDNLCDRAEVYEEEAFRRLHTSMLSAVEPISDIGRISGKTYYDKGHLSGKSNHDNGHIPGKKDYYSLYPYKDDSGYLNDLVEECQRQISVLPSYALIEKALKKYTGLYSDLQTYKHILLSEREQRVVKWAGQHTMRLPGVSEWEFCAATGSTLGIFILFAAAFDPNLGPDEVEKLEKAYFPWICGLHILLDYLIDYYEDIKESDLNFVSYYKDFEKCGQRLALFLERSIALVKELKYPEFHLTVIKGLLAMYLSDIKSDGEGISAVKKTLLARGGFKTKVYFSLCKLLRNKGKL